MGIDLLLYTVMFFTHSVDVMICVIFGFGALSSIRVNVGYVYLMELVPTKNQALHGTIWNNSECLIYPLAVIYFWQISKNWIYFSVIGYVLQIWSFFVSFFLPESPRWLIDQ